MRCYNYKLTDVLAFVHGRVYAGVVQAGNEAINVDVLGMARYITHLHFQHLDPAPHCIWTIVVAIIDDADVSR